MNVSHIEFSQRRISGYRQEPEFDHRRILIASDDNDIAVISIDELDRATIISRCQTN